MELKDIKTLQDMGYSLEQIKEVYFPDQQKPNDSSPESNEHLEPADQTSEDVSKNSSESKKKDSSEGSLSGLKAEISALKNLLYKQNASENKEGSKKPETADDILRNIIS